jgi:hypothetical protein
MTRKLMLRVLVAHLCLWRGNYQLYRWLLPRKWKHLDNPRLLAIMEFSNRLTTLTADIVFAESPLITRLRSGEILRTIYNGGRRIEVPVIARVLP